MFEGVKVLFENVRKGVPVWYQDTTEKFMNPARGPGLSKMTQKLPHLGPGVWGLMD